MNLDSFGNIFFSYTMSYFFCLFIITYFFNIPYFLPGKDTKKIIDDYYLGSFKKNIVLDYFLILVYLLLSYGVIYLIESTNIKVPISCKLLIISIVTAILTGIACTIYLAKKKDDNSIFSRLFHSVKYNSILYDIILVCSVFIIYEYINCKVKKYNNDDNN